MPIHARNRLNHKLPVSPLRWNAKIPIGGIWDKWNWESNDGTVLTTKSCGCSLKLPQRQRSKSMAQRLLPEDNSKTAKFFPSSGQPLLLSHSASPQRPGVRFRTATTLLFRLYFQGFVVEPCLFGMRSRIGGDEGGKGWTGVWLSFEWRRDRVAHDEQIQNGLIGYWNRQ
jgi:hypothetical protein